MERGAVSLVEINFDGIVGPTHNYAGLSFGNLAATAHAGDVSFPRAAALQGLDKMLGNLALGLAQGFFVPPPRPNLHWLEELAADRVYEFVFFYTPQRGKGATASNTAPAALAQPSNRGRQWWED